MYLLEIILNKHEIHYNKSRSARKFPDIINLSPTFTATLIHPYINSGYDLNAFVNTTERKNT